MKKRLIRWLCSIGYHWNAIFIGDSEFQCQDCGEYFQY